MATKVLGAEGVLQELMDDVVDSCADRAELFHGHDPSAALQSEMDALERGTDLALKQICAQNITEKERIKRIMAAVQEQNNAARSLITEVEADYADAFDETLYHLHTFGAEHLARAWAEAEAARATRAARASREHEQQLAAVRTRQLHANEGNFKALVSAQAAEEKEKLCVETLQRQVRQLTVQLHAETERADAEKTRADVAEKQLVKKFKQMESLTEHSHEASKKLLAKVEWLTGCWKREHVAANNLRVELRKARLDSGGASTQSEAETDPDSFQDSITQIREHAEEVQIQMQKMQNDHRSLREAIQKIIQEEHAVHIFEDAGRHQNDDAKQKAQARHSRRATRQRRHRSGAKAR
jgi:DNA repair exonuclease SbcCD ATPase subunit